MIYEKREMNRWIKVFAKNNYNGKKKSGCHFTIEDGECDVMISAPHAVNHYRNGEMKYADINTGVIAKMLNIECGCPIIYTHRYEEADANWDDISACLYKQALSQYVKEKNIKILIDIHGMKSASPYAIELGTVDEQDRSLMGYSFVAELFSICFEKYLRNLHGKSIVKNERFAASKDTTVTNYISEKCGIPCIQIEINKLFRENDTCYLAIEALKSAVALLKEIEWDSDTIQVYRAANAKTQFPLYKIEMADGAFYNTGDILIAMSDMKKNVEVECYEKEDAEKGTVYLTNRIRKIIFGEDNDYLGKPIVVCSSCVKKLSVGRPVAERLEVSVTPNTYAMIVKDKKNEYMLYNRFSGIQMHFEPTEYHALKEEKVMLSYYYRKLLRIELPLAEIPRYIVKDIMEEMSDDDRECFRAAYLQNVDKYVLRSNITEQEHANVTILEDRLGFGKVELLHKPRENKKNFKVKQWIEKWIDLLLEIYVGSKEVEFCACRSSYLIDDQLMIARLTKNMMTLLGVEENDHIWITYGDRKISLKVFEDDTSGEEADTLREIEGDIKISLPALARQELKMLSVNNIVKVRRDTRYCLKRHVSRQIFTILGTFLTIFTISENPIFRIVCGIVSIPIILYLDFSEERVAVKYRKRG